MNPSKSTHCVLTAPTNTPTYPIFTCGLSATSVSKSYVPLPRHSHSCILEKKEESVRTTTLAKVGSLTPQRQVPNAPL